MDDANGDNLYSCESFHNVYLDFLSIFKYDTICMIIVFSFQI